MFQRIDDEGYIGLIDYLSVFILLCVSGNPLIIYADTKLQYVATAALFVAFCFVLRKPIINAIFLRFFAVIVLLFCFQLLCLQTVSILADVNFIAKLYIAFLVSVCCGTKFREAYFRIMVVICMVSLIMYFLNSLAGIRVGFLFKRYQTIGIYNFCFEGDLVRNSGMFWEPGAFQGYIMLIPLLFYDKLRELLKSNFIPCLILIVALLTTKSTTAYMVFFVFVCLSLWFSKDINPVFSTVFVIAMLVFAFFCVERLDFLGDKILTDFKSFQEVQDGDVSWKRSGALKVDLYNIQRHPIIGNGFDLESRFGANADLMLGAGNGLSGAINIFGIPFVLLFFLLVYMNFYAFPVSKKLCLLLVVLMLLFGECFLNYPMFWALVFVCIPLSQDEELEELSEDVPDEDE